MQYRFSVKTPNVYAFCGFMSVNNGHVTHAGTLASYKNEASGFVSKQNVKSLLSDLKNSGIPFENFKLVTVKEFWKNYDKYSN